MDRYDGRRTGIEILIEGADITKEIEPYLISLEYTDNQEDECDDLQIKLQDREQLWTNSWLNNMVVAAASLVSSEAEQTEEVEETTSSEPETQTYHVSTKVGLWVRAGPGGKSANVEVFPYNTNVEVYEIVDGWARISYNGGDAWMCAQYLQSGDSGSGNVGGAGSSAGASKSDSSSSSESSFSKTEKIGTEQREAYEAKIRNMITGLKISATIIRYNWTGEGEEDRLFCGEFELDSLNVSGPPNVVTIKATSLSYNRPIRQTKRSQAWENYSLSGIAGEMAYKNGMQCSYLASTNPHYDYQEQDQQSDIDFLSDLCHEAGLSLKCTNNTLTIFSQQQEEAKSSVLTIRRGISPYSKYKLDISASGSNYNACRVSYVNERGKLIEGTAYAPSYSDPTQDTETGEITDTNQVLEISHRVTSIGEAEMLASYYLRLRNKYGKTISFDMAGNPILVSGVNIGVDGWGSFDGKYSITTAKHSVTNSGYKTSVSGRWIYALPKVVEASVVVQEAEEEEEETAPASLSVGDKVRVRDGAITFGGETALQSWCYDYTFTVIQVGGQVGSKKLSDDRIVIGKNGSVIAAMNIADLYKVE